MHPGLFVKAEFFSKVFLDRTNQGNLDDPVRGTQAAPAIEFASVSDDADIGLDDGVNFIARDRALRIRQPNVEGRFHQPAGFSLEKRVDFSVNRSRNELVCRQRRGRHPENFPLDEFDGLVKLPPLVIGIGIGTVGVELGNVGDAFHEPALFNKATKKPLTPGSRVRGFDF